MSEWYEVTDSDRLDLSFDKKSVQILFHTNNNGNCYVEVPVYLIENLLHPKEVAPVIPECEHVWLHNVQMGWKGCNKCGKRQSIEIQG